MVLFSDLLLRERLWEGVPDVSEVVSASHAKPFGKAGMAHVLEQLEAPAATLPPAPAFIAKQIADGTPIGKAEQRNRLARHGWPNVKFMFHQAYEASAVASLRICWRGFQRWKRWRPTPRPIISRRRRSLNTDGLG